MRYYVTFGGQYSMIYYVYKNGEKIWQHSPTYSFVYFESIQLAKEFVIKDYIEYIKNFSSIWSPYNIHLENGTKIYSFRSKNIDDTILKMLIMCQNLSEKNKTEIIRKLLKNFK